ncbi:hypothetical protein DSC45_09705 [Streptomyces sp. YIM 130001]|uniref:hypothetical protein n=1 Tax=Streptomyces sp. YIM 130001 TaxID=2259644 RepID=UPI000E65D8CA|nr:hypothetical protein [Streptomyces sp. YIM 130001]RII18885.1 hypothetical protein DSC45_09705 [Streptomyces sp. YIM 130001]
MRPAHDRSGGRSGTPIYDQLYAEWRRSFRTLPGDRSSEDELGFTAFGSNPLSDARDLSGPVGRHGRPAGGQHEDRPAPQPGQWYAVGRQPHSLSSRPQAALPPGPRRGH